MQKDGGKAADHEREAEALAVEVPALQARAEELAGQLKEAEQVGWMGGLGGVGWEGGSVGGVEEGGWVGGRGGPLTEGCQCCGRWLGS